MSKPKFDPRDCQDCMWNHSNYSDAGFGKSGHCQKLEDAPPVKCALCVSLTGKRTEPEIAEHASVGIGEWVLVKRSHRTKRPWLAQVVGDGPVSDLITLKLYRPKPEKFIVVNALRALVVGPAPHSDELQAAKDIAELVNVRGRRLKVGCVQRDLADLAGVQVRTVRDAEQGRRHTHPHIRRYILEALERIEKARLSRAS